MIAERQCNLKPEGMDIGVDTTVPIMKERPTGSRDNARNASEQVKPTRQLQRIVKIRKTPHGIVFSGETAYISNLYECDVEDDDIVHKSNKHGYFYNKAKVYKRPDIAKMIDNDPDQHKLKGECRPKVGRGRALQFKEV